MNILALDTSGPVLSAALSSPDGVRYIEIDAGSRHSELLVGLIDTLFKSAGMKPRDLEAAACMKGPGSFTGLRIGYAAAKGLSLALGIPLAAVPTLDCMAYPHSAWPGLVLPSLDAKKGCFFAAFYRERQRLGDYLDASPEVISGMLETFRTGKEEKVILTGPGAELLFSQMPDPRGLAVDPSFKRGRAFELLDKLRKNTILDYKEDECSGPLYLRKSDAELSLHP